MTIKVNMEALGGPELDQTIQFSCNIFPLNIGLRKNLGSYNFYLNSI